MEIPQHVLVFEYGWDEPYYMRNTQCQFTLFIPLKRMKPRVIRAQNSTKNDEALEKISKNLSPDSKSNENNHDEKSLPLYRRILNIGRGTIDFEVP